MPYKKGVCVKRVEARKKVRAFFPQGQSKMSVIPSVASKRGHETKKQVLIGCQT